MNSLKEIIKSRRSIFPKQYTDQKIPKEVIQEVLESANWAPTHKFTEPWRFHVLEGTALERLSKWAGEWYETNVTGNKYSAIKHKKIINNPLRASHIIAICMQRDPKESLPEWEEIAAVSMAVQNMWLTCADLGVGCYWSSPPYIKNAGEILDLNEGERCLGWFYMGYPIEGLPNEGKRKPIEDKVKYYSK